MKSVIVYESMFGNTEHIARRSPRGWHNPAATPCSWTCARSARTTWRVGPKTMAALDVDIIAFDGVHVPTTPPIGGDPMVFLNEAIKAQRVSVSAEHAVAEKLHGILSVMLFAQTTRMNEPRRG